MFNPYHARPIGSEKFEKHLLSLMVEGFETQEAAREALPEVPISKQRAYQEKKASYDPIMEGYKALANAILAQTICDYLDAYENRLRLEDEGRDDLAYVWECRCLTIENEYFRKDEDDSALLDCILRYVIHNPEDNGYYRWRRDRIRQAKHRLQIIIHNC